MNLIEEIEAAAERHRAQCTIQCNYADESVFRFLNGEYWLRIKAALEAAEELYGYCNHSRPLPGAKPAVMASMNKFRAPFEGKE